MPMCCRWYLVVLVLMGCMHLIIVKIIRWYIRPSMQLVIILTSNRLYVKISGQAVKVWIQHVLIMVWASWGMWTIEILHHYSISQASEIIVCVLNWRQQKVAREMVLQLLCSERKNAHFKAWEPLD
ncbi:hypothetical protein BDR03DRAFT_987772 [Suillus americanus]|nr:hypothetical protein BDR03DRAFT_987772 [Suillus americanus]